MAGLVTLGSKVDASAKGGRACPGTCHPAFAAPAAEESQKQAAVVSPAYGPKSTRRASVFKSISARVGGSHQIGGQSLLLGAMDPTRRVPLKVLDARILSSHRVVAK